MNLIRDLSNLKSYPQGCAITIGNFDGVHLGHQALFKQLQAIARPLNLPIVVITFDPQAQEFFSDNPPARLTKLREKLDYFSQFGIENVICLRFNATLSQVGAQEFVEDILIRKLNMRYLIVGEDFQFGHQRQGNYALLEEFSHRYSFTLAKSVVVSDAQGERISSTRIRARLAGGEFAKAQVLLGHSYKMIGRVVQGKQLGRTLGFPTANIQIGRRTSPLQGIFAVKIHGLNQQIYKGVANLGTCPAVGGRKILLEVHFFDFDQIIYGKILQIEFCHKLRDEQDFANLALLTEQIANDVVNAKEYFNERL